MLPPISPIPLTSLSFYLFPSLVNQDVSKHDKYYRGFRDLVRVWLSALDSGDGGNYAPAHLRRNDAGLDVYAWTTCSLRAYVHVYVLYYTVFYPMYRTYSMYMVEVFAPN